MAFSATEQKVEYFLQDEDSDESDDEDYVDNDENDEDEDDDSSDDEEEDDNCHGSGSSSGEEDEKHPLLRKFTLGNLKCDFDSPLGKALKKISAEAICTGKIDASVSRSATIRLNKSGSNAEMNLGTLLQPNIDQIVTFTNPSPFGQNDQTVYDETIRKGLELIADEFYVENEIMLLQNVKKQIQEKLFPSISGGADAITLKRYKMALYQEGGHFQFHRDTLHADNHQATLLLEVRSAHEGGTFVIDHYGTYSKSISRTSHNSDLRSHSKKKKATEIKKKYKCFCLDFDKKGNDGEPLKWVAFYTDALHMVDEVISGTRIVIQYDVYVDPVDEASNISDEGDEDSEDGEERPNKRHRVDSDNNDGVEEQDDRDNEGDDDDDDDDDEDYNEEDEEEESSEEESDESILNDYEPYLEDRKPPVSRFPGACPSGIGDILALLDSRMSKSRTTNIAIPLFHRYSAASIKYELLKATDRQLFEAIIKTGKYVLGLSPITIVVESDADGKYDEKCYKITFTESINESYEINEDTNNINTISINQKHFLNKRKCMYIVTKREGSWTLESSNYKEYVGNDAQPGRYKYFLGVIIIGRK